VGGDAEIVTIFPRPAIATLAFRFVAAARNPNTLTEEERREGFIPLFDGKSLDGWEGDLKLWSVRDGAITGSTEGHPIQEPVHLCRTRELTDFILKADSKLRNRNGGFQFCSGVLPGSRMMGYQADACDEGQQKNGPSSGNFYGQYGRGRRINKLNGVVTIDTMDDRASTGLVGIQLHQGEPMEVYVRSFEVKPLSAKRAGLFESGGARPETGACCRGGLRQ
jgi:hypothetical protein